MEHKSFQKPGCSLTRTADKHTHAYFSAFAMKLPTTRCCHQCPAGPLIQPRSVNVLNNSRRGAREQKPGLFTTAKQYKSFSTSSRAAGVTACEIALSPVLDKSWRQIAKHHSGTNNGQTFSFFFQERLLLFKALKMPMQGLFQPH